MERTTPNRERWGLGIAFFVAFAIVATLMAVDVTFSTPTDQRATLSKFLTLLRHGANASYTAAYAVADYDFYQSGSIEVTNLLNAPSTKAVANVDGYASTLHTAYIYRGAHGRVVQWIQSGSQISACLTIPSSTGYADLQCSRPFPNEQSIGFSEEAIGLVPTFVYQTVESFGPDYLAKNSIHFDSSQQFGKLTSLLQQQRNRPMRQITCVNRAGFVVSWNSHNDTQLVGGATLNTFVPSPTYKALRTLVKPTKSMILPPF